jgi:hypothetical protein
LLLIRRSHSFLAENSISTVEEETSDSSLSQERLKEALEEGMKRQSGLEIEPVSWMEYFFGICRPNGRLGKQGSRSNACVQITTTISYSNFSFLINKSVAKEKSAAMAY